MPDASTITEHAQKHLCCGGTHKEFWNGCLSLLVPLMIAVFTIATTILQMDATRTTNQQNLKIATDNRDIANYTRHQELAIEDGRLKREHDYQNQRWENEKSIAQENRKQDLQIAKDNREKDERIEQLRHERDIQIANETRLHQIAIEEARLQQERQIEDERRAADFRAAQNRQMDTILATYLKEMSDFLLAENFTLENHRLVIVLRAKTLAVIRQLDYKRKSHLVQFLYEAELLFNNRNPLDLSDAELDRIDLNGKKLNNISLSGAILRDANFTGTSLANSNFNRAQLMGASFSDCQAFNSNFTDARLIKSSFEKGQLDNAIFVECDASEANFTEAILTNATFVRARLTNTSYRKIQGRSVLFDQAVLDDADFDEAYLVEASFQSASLRSTYFKKAKLSATNWQNATVLGANFREAQLRAANINKQQLRQTFSFEKAVFNKGMFGSKTNLLVNGDAEWGTRAGCSTTRWITNKSMIARKYLSLKTPTILGTCYFTGRENELDSSMRQRVDIVNLTENAGKSRRIWFYGRCRRLNAENEFLPEFHVREFNHENYNLKDNKWALSSRDEQTNDEKSFPCNTATTQVELEIAFKRKVSALSNETFGYCNNIRLAVYDNTYS